MSSIFRRNVSQKNLGGHPGDEQKRRVSSTHRQEPTESSCSTEYDPGLCLSQNTGLTSGILRRKVANGKRLMRSAELSQSIFALTDYLHERTPASQLGDVRRRDQKQEKRVTAANTGASALLKVRL